MRTLLGFLFSLVKLSKAKSKEITRWFSETFVDNIDRMGKITATFKCKIRFMFYDFQHSSSAEDIPPHPPPGFYYFLRAFVKK